MADWSERDKGIARDATEKGGSNAKPGETNGDIEGRATGHSTGRHFRSLRRAHKQIDQGFAADKNHDAVPLFIKTTLDAVRHLRHKASRRERSCARREVRYR
jgi:hypothetical protein